MQQDILFKKIDNKINIIVNDSLTYDKFLDALKNRLEKLYIKDEFLRTNVVLDIKNISLNSKQILKLFDVLEMSGNIYISKIIYNEKNDKNIILHEGNIRAGETKLFTNNVLLIGNINVGAKVIVNGNLYVIGNVCGSIEFKNIHNKLMASNINNAYIKICSFDKNISGVLENRTIMIEKNEIVEERFMDRRDRIYGKSDCSYIW